jgi:hypothetical protein
MEISMALKGQMSRTILYISFLALDISVFFYLSISGLTGTVSARSSNFKIREVPQTAISSEAGTVLREISIKNAAALPVVQQPKGNTNYVSSKDGEVTQFASAALYGNIGLLAHNYLSGSSFSQLDVGHKVRLTYEDGKVKDFIVTEILRYQALDPKSPYSSFQNLSNENEILTVRQMFDRAYLGDHHLTLQTCIAADGISSWGRLFIIASPKSEYLSMDPVNLYRRP